MSRRTRKNVGLIGLGIIGSRIREVLRQKGFQVFVWNRTPRPVPNFVGAPAELAEMCDFIQIFVSDDDALLYIAKQLSPGLSARHIVLAHSTVSPQTMVAAAEIVERRGARFIEAPFTGSKEAAEKGELVYYVGGDEAVVREARPLLEATSKKILEIGETGQATAIKIATNMVTAASVQSAAEALALIQAVGLPLEKFALAMQQNASNSTTLSMKLPKMIQGDFERHFSVQHMLKDMQIASRLGLSHHLELAVSAAARDRLLEQMQRGHGEDDYSAVARKYFQDAPAENPTEGDLELFKATAAPPSPPVPVEPIVENGLSAPVEPLPVTGVEAAPSVIERPAATIPDVAAPSAAPVAEEVEHRPEDESTPDNPELIASGVGESSPKHSERGNGENAVMPSASDYLPEPVEQLEEDQPRGFFSRLLRRADNY